MASCSIPSKELKLDNTLLGLGPNWLELPIDLTSKILHMLSAVEIVINARQVCPMWRSICKDHLMWRTIEMINGRKSPHDLEKICMFALDHGRNHVEEINIEYFASDELIKYIADRTSNLRRIRISKCLDISDKVMSDAAKKFSLLEELELSFNDLSYDSLEAIGENCPRLKILKFNRTYKGINCMSYKGFKCDKEALAIAKTMPKLHHLQLWGNKLTNEGLVAILDGCPLLESLDLRFCYNIVLRGNLEKRCYENIKDLRHPNEYIDENDDDDDDFVYEFYCECRVRGSKGMKGRKITRMDYYKFH